MRDPRLEEATQALIMLVIVANTKTCRVIDAHVPDSDLDRDEAAHVTVKASAAVAVADTAAFVAAPETGHTAAVEDGRHGRPAPGLVRSCSRSLCLRVGGRSLDRPAAGEYPRTSVPRVSPSCPATFSLRDSRISCSQHDSIHMSSDDEVGGEASVVGHYEDCCNLAWVEVGSS